MNGKHLDHARQDAMVPTNGPPVDCWHNIATSTWTAVGVDASALTDDNLDAFLQANTTCSPTPRTLQSSTYSQQQGRANMVFSCTGTPFEQVGGENQASDCVPNWMIETTEHKRLIAEGINYARDRLVCPAFVFNTPSLTAGEGMIPWVTTKASSCGAIVKPGSSSQVLAPIIIGATASVVCFLEVLSVGAGSRQQDIPTDIDLIGTGRRDFDCDSHTGVTGVPASTGPDSTVPDSTGVVADDDLNASYDTKFGVDVMLQQQEQALHSALTDMDIQDRSRSSEAHTSFIIDDATVDFSDTTTADLMTIDWVESSNTHSAVPATPTTIVGVHHKIQASGLQPVLLVQALMHGATVATSTDLAPDPTTMSVMVSWNGQPCFDGCLDTAFFGVPHNTHVRSQDFWHGHS